MLRSRRGGRRHRSPGYPSTSSSRRRRPPRRSSGIPRSAGAPKRSARARGDGRRSAIATWSSPWSPSRSGLDGVDPGSWTRWRAPTRVTRPDRSLPRGIQAPGAEALEIQHDPAKAQGLEPRHHTLAHGGLGEPRELRERDLDARDLAMVAHPELVESQLAQERLAALDLVEVLARDRRPVGNAAREAGRCGLAGA